MNNIMITDRPLLDDRIQLSISIDYITQHSVGYTFPKISNHKIIPQPL